MLSSSSLISNAVWPLMRKAVEPLCSSARAPGAVCNRSPLDSGRLNSAALQSSLPAGAKRTSPSIKLRRATRPDGVACASAWLAVSAMASAPRKWAAFCKKMDSMACTRVITLVSTRQHAVWLAYPANAALTAADTWPISALPANCALAAPISLPMSPAPRARPSSATMAAARVRTSAATCSVSRRWGR